MREIKFKAKRVDGGGWVYGYYHLAHRNVHRIYELGYVNTIPFEVVNLETVSQFTGLQDKNGVDIYEGDTFLMNDQSNTVTYIKGSYRLIGNHKDVYKQNYDLLSEFLVDGTLEGISPNFDGVTIKLEKVGSIHD